MDIAAQLETYANELAVAAKSVADHLRDIQASSGSASNATAASTSPRPVFPPDAPPRVHKARRTILANTARLQTLLVEPSDFLQRLATQNQLIACLQWLGYFQVLACIPATGSVSVKDVAHLSAVCETQLSRVIRMTATAGFLSEPQTGYVAHTAISAQFVSTPAFHDAAMFLADCAAPAALHMAVHARRLRESEACGDNASAYSLAFSDARQTFQQACDQRPKLERQWAAYLQQACNRGNAADDDITEVLTRLDWSNLGGACVVEAGAQSSEFASTLADLYPALHFVVQIDTCRPPGAGKSKRQQAVTRGCSNGAECEHPHQTDLNPAQITVQTRSLGTPQTVNDAAVYILRLPSSSPSCSSFSSPLMPGPPFRSLSSQIVAELRAHQSVLRASSRSTLILAPRTMLPEPGTVDADIEAVARLRDLSLFQLVNEREVEMAELVELVKSVGDDFGRLVVVTELRSRNNAVAALGVKYMPYTSNSGHDFGQPAFGDRLAGRRTGSDMGLPRGSVIEW